MGRRGGREGGRGRPLRAVRRGTRSCRFGTPRKNPQTTPPGRVALLLQGRGGGPARASASSKFGKFAREKERFS
jgi:hypothetical protein